MSYYFPFTRRVAMNMDDNKKGSPGVRNLESSPVSSCGVSIWENIVIALQNVKYTFYQTG